MSERNSNFRLHPGVPMARHPIPSRDRMAELHTSAIHGIRQAWLDAKARGGGPDPRPIQVGHRGPSCMLANRPRRNTLVVSRALPATPSKASSIVELRDWATKDLNWLKISRWSRGLTALDRPVRQRVLRTPVADMTLAQLASSQGDELPTISDLAYEELGVGALALDQSPTGDDSDEEETGTIGSQIPQPTREALGFVGLRNTEITPEIEAQLDALRLRLAHRYARFGTPLEQPSPEIRDRIEWETFVSQCSAVSSEGFVIERDRVRYTCWPRPKAKESRDSWQAAYTRFWLASRNLDAIPPREAWMARHAAYLARERDERPAARQRWLDTERIFAELDAARGFVNYDGGASAEIVDRDYVPSLDLLQMKAWALYNPGHWVDRAEYATLRALARAQAYTEWRRLNKEAKPFLKHICRNTRCHDSNDESWHVTPRDPDEFVIGWTEGGFPYASRRLPARAWMKRTSARTLQRKALSLSTKMQIIATANNIAREYAAWSVEHQVAAEQRYAALRHRAGSGVA